MDISQLISKQGIGYSDITGANSVSSSVEDVSQHDELKTAAKKFEAVFVRQILKQMQETIENTSFDPEDSANQQVHGMYCTYLGDMIAQQGGFGLWEKIYEQMVRMSPAQSQSDQQQVTSPLDEEM